MKTTITICLLRRCIRPLVLVVLAALIAAPTVAQLTVLPQNELTPKDRGSETEQTQVQRAWFSAPSDFLALHTDSSAQRGSAIGDTYSLAPVVQDNESPAGTFAMTSPTESTVTAGTSSSTNIGANFYGSSGGTFRVDTTVVEDSPTEGIHTVQTCVVAVDSNGAREIWVASGQTGPGKETLFTWRLDVGDINATNTIDFQTDLNLNLIDAYTVARDVSGSLIFSGGQTLSTVDGQSVSGVTLLQFQIDSNPVEIAGFDLAEICLGWQVAETIFSDGFESGNTSAWTN